jgi:hypothetical protein
VRFRLPIKRVFLDRFPFAVVFAWWTQSNEMQWSSTTFSLTGKRTWDELFCTQDGEPSALDACTRARGRRVARTTV